MEKACLGLRATQWEGVQVATGKQKLKQDMEAAGTQGSAPLKSSHHSLMDPHTAR
jgi:hypothetical protein